MVPIATVVFRAASGQLCVCEPHRPLLVNSHCLLLGHPVTSPLYASRFAQGPLSSTAFSPLGGPHPPPSSPPSTPSAALRGAGSSVFLKSAQDNVGGGCERPWVQVLALLLPVRKHGCLVQVSQNGLERGLESETLPIGRVPLVRQGPGPSMCEEGSWLQGVQQTEGALPQGGSGLEAGSQSLPPPGRGSRELERVRGPTVETGPP